MCIFLNCETMRNLWNHMKSCQAGNNCTVSLCETSKQILNHAKRCNQSDCPLCLPIRKSNVAPETASTRNPYKLFERELALLLHAHICLYSKSLANGEMRQCTSQDCQMANNVLNHMKSPHTAQNIAITLQ